MKAYRYIHPPAADTLDAAEPRHRSGSPYFAPPSVWCTPCGLPRYFSRRDARKARRTMPNRNGLSIFWCPVMTGHRHIAPRPAELTCGHLDRTAVTHGMRTYSFIHGAFQRHHLPRQQGGDHD